MFRWLTRLLVEPYEERAQEIQKAERARREAERKLEETEQLGGEVKFLSAWARNIRADNHFSARITEAFGRAKND